jgi:thiosulfate/3-mercaptopyruvate sulfurtransferase
VTVRIISAADLARELGAKIAGVSIVDARRRNAFGDAHIPGAVWIGWEQWCEPAPAHAAPTLRRPGYWGVLAPVDEDTLNQRLGALGLLAERPIVVYGDGPKTRGREGRTAWMLAYFGAAEVALLDGGWSAWRDAGSDVQTAEIRPAPEHFNVRLQSYRRSMLEDLCRTSPAGASSTLIDTRSPEEYAGEIQEYLPRRGHLPGARLVPFSGLFEPDGRYLSRHGYMSAFSDLARNTPIAAYCEVGVRASLFAMLHEAYTGQVVPVYDGSLMEWALHPDLEMEDARPRA